MFLRWCGISLVSGLCTPLQKASMRGVLPQFCCWRLSGTHSYFQFPKQSFLRAIVEAWYWSKVVSSLSSSFSKPHSTRVTRSSIFCICISTVSPLSFTVVVVSFFHEPASSFGRSACLVHVQSENFFGDLVQPPCKDL